jgi:hypothetical protein
MDLPVLINLIAGVGFVFFWLVAFFIFYHLTRFGIGLLPKRIAALFIVGAVIFFSASLIAYFSLNLHHL